MPESKKEQNLKSWTDYFVDDIPKIFGYMFLFWLIVGLLPSLFARFNVAQSGQIGDMFGMANSLFSGFAFTAAMLALVLQVRETRESGERQLKQEALQTQQMQLAKDTADIQRKLMDSQNAQFLMPVLTRIIHNTYRLRSVWIEFPKEPLSSPLISHLKDEWKKVREAIEQDALTVELIFPMSGSELAKLLRNLVQSTVLGEAVGCVLHDDHDEPVNVYPAEDVIAFFDGDRGAILHLVSDLWAAQAGFAVAELPKSHIEIEEGEQRPQ